MENNINNSEINGNSIMPSQSLNNQNNTGNGASPQPMMSQLVGSDVQEQSEMIVNSFVNPIMNSVEANVSQTVQPQESSLPLPAQEQSLYNGSLNSYSQTEFVTHQTNIISQPEIPTPTALDTLAPVAEKPLMSELYNHQLETVELNHVETIGMNSNQPISLQPSKNHNKKWLFIIVGILLIAVVAGIIYLFIFNNDNNKEQTENKGQVDVDDDWDPSTSKIVLNDSTSKLNCLLESNEYDLQNKLMYTYLYDGDTYIQVVVEDEIIFTEETLQYYNYYVGSAEEEILSLEEMYDNVTAEVRQKKSSVSMAYSFDMTASEENPKNLLVSKDMSMKDMKIQMEEEGFICE